MQYIPVKKALYTPIYILGVPPLLLFGEAIFILFFALFISFAFILLPIACHIITVIALKIDPFFFYILRDLFYMPDYNGKG